MKNAVNGLKTVRKMTNFRDLKVDHFNGEKIQNGGQFQWIVCHTLL